MHTILRRYTRVAFAALFMMVGVSVFAFTFMPMSVSISPSGAQSVASFRLTNDSSQQIAISIKAMTRSIDENGNEINEPADKDFTIFPTRVVVQPNSFQNIKVQYKGTTKLTKEMAYRIIAEQVPIDFAQTQSSGVKVLFRYIAALYVAPPNVKEMVSVSKVEYGEQEGKHGFWVTVTNSGTRHALINDPRIEDQWGLYRIGHAYRRPGNSPAGAESAPWQRATLLHSLRKRKPECKLHGHTVGNDRINFLSVRILKVDIKM